MSLDKLVGRPKILGDESQRLTICLTKKQADYMRSQAEGSHVTISATFRDLVDAAMSGSPIELPELPADGH